MLADGRICVVTLSAELSGFGVVDEAAAAEKLSRCEWPQRRSTLSAVSGDDDRDSNEEMCDDANVTMRLWRSLRSICW